jgi:hypothetical protein
MPSKINQNQLLQIQEIAEQLHLSVGQHGVFVSFVASLNDEEKQNYILNKLDARNF